MSAVVEEILRHLYESKGELDLQDVVDSAQNPESPLHEEFEWDDVKAAGAWRLHQAGAVIRSIRILFDPKDAQKVTL